MEVAGRGGRNGHSPPSCDPPTGVCRLLVLPGPGGCLPTPPWTLAWHLAPALGTALLGPGKDAPSPSQPRLNPTQAAPLPRGSQHTGAFGSFLEEPAHFWAHQDPGR